MTQEQKYLLPSCCLLFSLSTTCDRIQIQVRLCLLWILHCGASGMPRASVTWPSCRFLTSWASQRLVVVSSFSTWAKVLSFSWSGRHWRSASLALRKEQHKTSFEYHFKWNWTSNLMKTLNESADIFFQIINVRLERRVRQKQKIIRINKNIIFLNDEQLQHVVHFSVYVVIPKCFK